MPVIVVLEPVITAPVLETLPVVDTTVPVVTAPVSGTIEPALGTIVPVVTAPVLETITPLASASVSDAAVTGPVVAALQPAPSITTGFAAPAVAGSPFAGALASLPVAAHPISGPVIETVAPAATSLVEALTSPAATVAALASPLYPAGNGWNLGALRIEPAGAEAIVATLSAPAMDGATTVPALIVQQASQPAATVTQRHRSSGFSFDHAANLPALAIALLALGCLSLLAARQASSRNWQPAILSQPA